MLLPASCVPRRSCNADVIGAALLGGAAGLAHRKVAAQLQVPAATVRDWLRGVARGAAWLTAHAITAAAGADTLPEGPAPGGLARVLAALGAAACSFVRGTLPGPGRPGGLTGIDCSSRAEPAAVWSRSASSSVFSLPLRRRGRTGAAAADA